MANWQTTGNDISSISVDPQFVNAAGANYEPANTAFLNLGIPLSTVTDDLFGNPRSATAPNMSAIECCGVPLSVKLSSVKAANKGDHNRIDWTTASEEDAAYFELERSTDGKSFAYLMHIAAKGSANSYTYWDEKPTAGMNYYRLKMVATSGKFEYSKVVNAFVTKDNAFTVEAYPNPAGAMLHLNVHGDKADNAQVELSDITGKILYRNVYVGTTDIDVKHLANGIYFIKYSDAVRSKTIKITKE